MNKTEALDLLRQELIQRGATFALRGDGDYETGYRGRFLQWNSKGLDNFCDRMVRTSETHRFRMLSELVDRALDEEGPGARV